MLHVDITALLGACAATPHALPAVNMRGGTGPRLAIDLCVSAKGDASRQRKVRVRAGGTLSVDNGPARGRVCEPPSPHIDTKEKMCPHLPAAC